MEEPRQVSIPEYLTKEHVTALVEQFPFDTPKEVVLEKVSALFGDAFPNWYDAVSGYLDRKEELYQEEL